LAAALCPFLPTPAFADVRNADVVLGQTVDARGLSVAQCPSVDAEYALVMDAEGTVYFERNAQSPAQIASITKIMTAVVALDAVEAGETTLDAADLQLEVTGRSRVTLRGKVRYMDAVVSTAVVDASQLQAMAVTVDASNKAEVTVQATERVVMKSTTGAVIRYAGNPSIERSHTSSMLSGTFERLNTDPK